MQHSLDFFNGVRRIPAVDDGVTVGANGPQVCHRVNFILCANVRQLPQMVNVDEACVDLPVPFAEIEFADTAPRSMMSDALLPRFWITLIRIDHHLPNCPLKVDSIRVHFISRNVILRFVVGRIVALIKGHYCCNVNQITAFD